MEKEIIYIIGFGWASIGFLHNIDNTKYTTIVISDKDYFLYTPLLAQNVVQDKDLTINIKELQHKCSYIKGKIIDLDIKKNELISDKDRYKYNYAVFSHGSDVNTFNIQGVQENTFFLKTHNDYIKIRDQLLKLKTPSNIAVIGCGLTGSELIGTLNDLNKHNIIAIDALKHPLSTFCEKLSNYAIELWKKNNVSIHLNSMVKKINKNSIDIKDSPSISFDLAIWCGGIKSNKLSQTVNKQLQLSCLKGIPVDNYLHIKNQDKLFAIGDCAVSGYPPTAQVAYKQGEYLAKQFNNKFTLQPFEYSSKGQVGYIGNKESIFQNNYFSGSGRMIGVLNKAIHIYNYGKMYVLSKF